MSWNVLVTRPIAAAGMDLLREFADVTVTEDATEEEAIWEDIDRFDAIVLRVSEVRRETMERASNLKVVARVGVGVDSVDVDAATEHGIAVCNTPGANTQAVVEHTLALIFALRKRLLVADRDVRDGVWNKPKFTAPELNSQTLGVFGAGNIGRIVTERALALGMDAIAFDPYVDEDDLPAGIGLVESKDALFEEADIISVHTPLTDETRHAVSSAELASLGKDGILVNCGRGAVVDEEALATALADDVIAGAGLDVFEQEPPDPDSPILDREDVILTPHVAYRSIDSLEATAIGAATCVRSIHDGELPENTVNADELE